MLLSFSLSPLSLSVQQHWAGYIYAFYLFVLLFPIGSAALSRVCSYAFFPPLYPHSSIEPCGFLCGWFSSVLFFLRLYSSIESRVQLSGWLSFAASVQQHWTVSTVKRVVFFCCICTATLSPVYSYAGGFLLLPFCICTKTLNREYS